MLRQIELADAAPETAERRLTFVFAGAGFAGVETLAELQELAAGALRRHPRLAGIEPRWVLVDRAPRILGQVPEGLARFAARTLSRRGVEILTETSLESVDAGGVQLSGGRRIETETVVWTAGVTPNPLLAAARPAARRARPRARRRDAGGRRDARRVGARRLRRGAERRHARRDRPGDLPARAAPGASARAQPARARRSRTATARAARWRRSAAATASPRPARCASAASTAGCVARAYHLLALPFVSRRSRVLADWASAAVFRRDVCVAVTGVA